MRIRNILDKIGEYIVIAYYYVAGFLMGVAADSDVILRKFVKFLAITSAVIVGLFIVSLVLGWEWLAFIIAWVAGLAVLAGFVVPDLLIDFILSIIGTKNFIGRKINAVAGDLYRAFLVPFLSIALLCAFVSAVVAIRGVEDLTWENIRIWLAVGLFFIIFSKFFRGRTLVFEYILLGILLFMLFLNYLTPIPMNAAIFYIERQVTHTSNEVNQSDVDADFIIVNKGTNLYNKDMNFVKKADDTVKAKILGSIVRKKTNEQVYKITLPDSNGDYMEDQIYYIPVRNAKSLEEAKEQTTTQINYQPKTPKLPKIQRKLIEFNGVDSVNTELVSMKNAKVSFNGLTVPIEVLGPDGKQKITIPAGDQDKMGMKDNDLLTLYTHGQSGKVELEITLDYYKTTDYYKTLQQ